MSGDIKIKTRKDNKVGGNRKPQTYRYCVICGKLFGPLKRLSQLCCSKECGYKKRKRDGSKKRGKHYPHLRRAEQKICPICGKIFYGVKERNGKLGGKIRLQKYCSKECWSKRNPPETKKCVYCGKEFKTYERKSKIYCSKKCYDLDKKRRMSGEKSHLWRGGKTQENKLLRQRAEYREWRKKVFERDNYTCQMCGARSQKGKRIELNVDHIKPFALYPELRFEVNNGRTLCKECHKKTPTYAGKLSQVIIDRWEQFSGKKAVKV